MLKQRPMKVLLDGCTSVQGAQGLAGPSSAYGRQDGLGGDLLRPAEAGGFELLIICDKNLRHQQNLTGSKLAILGLWTNHRPPLENHWDYIRRHSEAMHPGEYRVMAAP